MSFVSDIWLLGAVLLIWHSNFTEVKVQLVKLYVQRVMPFGQFCYQYICQHQMKKCGEKKLSVTLSFGIYRIASGQLTASIFELSASRTQDQET